MNNKLTEEIRIKCVKKKGGCLMEGWEKKPQIKALIEKGKVSGKLATHDIDNVVLEIEGFDVDDIEKLYELIESNSIEIIDVIADEMLDALSFDIESTKTNAVI